MFEGLRLCLLTLAFVHSQAGHIFERREIHDSQWTSSPVTWTDFMACSHKCAMSSSCSAFSWVNNGCMHGAPNFSQNRTGAQQPVYIRSTEKKAVEFVASLTPEQQSKRLHLFRDDGVVALGNLYWGSRIKQTYEEANRGCGDFGGFQNSIQSGSTAPDYFLCVISL